MRISRHRAVALLLASSGVTSGAIAVEPPAVSTGEATLAAKPVAGISRFSGPGLGDRKLAASRGASGQASATEQLGNLQNASATQVETGSNVIRDGSFAGALGLTTVIQNTGANVLIQNSTTLNVQLK